MKKLFFVFTFIFCFTLCNSEEFEPAKIGADLKTTIRNMMENNYSVSYNDGIVSFKKDDLYYNVLPVQSIDIIAKNDKIIIEKINFNNIYTKTTLKYILLTIFDNKLTIVERNITPDLKNPNLYDYEFYCYSDNENIYYLFNLFDNNDISEFSLSLFDPSILN